MMGSILVCVDSPGAREAPLRYAIDWARWHHAVVELALFLEEPVQEAAVPLGEDVPPEPPEEDEEATAPEHDPLIVRATQLCADAAVPWRTVTMEGDRLERIAERSRLVDLVVLSRRDAVRGAWVAGFPYAVKVLGQSGRAVLVAASTYQKVSGLVALYEDGGSAARGLSAAADLAALARLPLTVVAVARRPEDADVLAGKARRYLEGRKVEADCRGRGGDARREIQTVVGEERGIAVVAGVHFPPAWARVTRHPPAGRIVSDLDVPVLLVA